MVRKSTLKTPSTEIHNHDALKLGIQWIETLCQEKTLIDEKDSNANNYSKKRNLNPITKDLKSYEEFFPAFGKFVKSKGVKEWKDTYADCFKNFTNMINALKEDTTALFTSARGFSDDSIECYDDILFEVGKKHAREDEGYEQAADNRCLKFLANYITMKARMDDTAATCETLRQYRIVMSRYGLD